MLSSPLVPCSSQCQLPARRGAPGVVHRPKLRASSVSVRCAGVSGASVRVPNRLRLSALPEDNEADGRRGERRGGGRKGGRRDGGDSRKDGLEERVVHVTRVSKTVKGGRNISFRATVVVGNRDGQVGVGNSSAKEIGTAVMRATTAAKKAIIDVPLDPKTKSFPHRAEVSFGAARVMLRPAADGTGVVAGGAVRVVLELAGVKNGFGKQLGSSNPMNNAKAAIQALSVMRTFKTVANDRGVTVAFLEGRSLG